MVKVILRRFRVVLWNKNFVVQQVKSIWYSAGLSIFEYVEFHLTPSIRENEYGKNLWRFSFYEYTRTSRSLVRIIFRSARSLYCAILTPNGWLHGRHSYQKLKQFFFLSFQTQRSETCCLTFSVENVEPFIKIRHNYIFPHSQERRTPSR